MKVLRNYSVGARQTCLAALGALILTASALVGIAVSRELNEHSARAFVAKDVLADILPPPLYLIELRLVLSQQLDGTVPVAQAQKDLERMVQEYQARAEHWRTHAPAGLEHEVLGEQHRHALAFIAKAREMLAESQAGRTENARQRFDEAHQLYQAHRRAVDNTVTVATAQADTAMADFNTASKHSQRMLLGILSIGLTGILGLNWVFARAIIRPLRQARDLASAVARGDLTQRTEVHGKDEPAQLLGSLNQMCSSLARLVDGVRNSSLGVANAAAQLADSNEQLMAQAEKHRAELRATSSSLKDITQFVHDNAKSAEDANQLARDTAHTANGGVEAVEHVSQTMKGITRSAEEVADIVGLIDSLAFQTNLLALNAAVEAARAGEQGRGFAVVASEVRMLAKRSANAAKRIKDLVQRSSSEVQAGGKLALHTQQTISDMVDKVRVVSTLVQGIWETTFAQSSGINMLGESVSGLAEDAQRTSTLVLQVSTLSQNLQDEATSLQRAVEMFNVSAAC